MRIETSIPAADLRFGIEGGALYTVRPSPDGSAKLLKIIPSKGAVEIWLIDQTSNRLADFLSDMNVDWASDQFFVASRSHMGASTSFIYQIGANRDLARRSEAIPQLLAFDPINELIVQFSADKDDSKLIVSPVFGGIRQEIAVAPEYLYLSDALGSFSQVRIEECVLRYEIKRAGQIKSENAPLNRELCPTERMSPEN
ncbi:MAG: hypothetical protein HWE25_09675 [Alphaproteobacteria bacterium]|nr:hypothetical protein [Alphaproteobacteria bacterium]